MAESDQSQQGEEYNEWKRRAFMAATAAAGSAGLAGCTGTGDGGGGDGGDGGDGGGGDGGDGGDGGGGDGGGSGKIELLTTYTSPASKDSYKANTEAFKEDHPDVTVSMGFTNWEDIYSRLVNAANTGNWPDMAFFIDNELSLLLDDQGFAADPEPIMERMQEVAGPIADNVPETHYQAKDGSFYTIQTNNQSNSFWYRTDVLEDIGMDGPPKTWSEELEFAEKAHEADNGLHGNSISVAKNNYESTTFYSRIRGAGGNALDPEKNVVIDSQVTRDVLEHWNKLAEYAAPGNESFSYGEAYTTFATDKVASCYYWGRTLINVVEQTPEIQDQVSVAHNPQPDNDKASPDEVTVMSGDGGQAMKEAKNPELATDWFANYMKPEFFVDQFMVGTPGNTTPIFQDHQEPWNAFDIWSDVEHGEEIKTTLVEDARKAHPKCRAGPDFPAFPELAGIVRGTTFNGPSSQYFAGQISADEAAKEMAKRAEEHVSEYGSN
jgi:ABC-type glycerol-3-phosphate transport system substrate-binding protein